MISKWLEDVVRHRGAAHAVVQRDTYLSFRGLLHRASRRAKELQAIGVERGDAVGVMLGNVADYPVLAVALDQLGAALIPVAPLCSGQELDAIQRLVPLRALITRPGAKVLDRGEAERAPESPAPTARSRLQGSLLSCALFPRRGRLEDGTTLVFVNPAPGSTYRAVHRSAEQLAAEAENIALALGVSESDRIGAALPFHHPFGLVLSLTMTFGYGAQLHLDDDLSGRRSMLRVRESELTIVPVSRSLLREFCELPLARPLKTDTRFLCAEGAVGRGLSQAFHRLFKQHIRGAYHRAETGLVALDRDGKSPHTVGCPISGVEVRFRGPKGRVAKGRRGRLEVRGPSVSAPPNEWCDTSEQASLDKQGRLKVLPRGDDLRSVEGLLVSLDEVRQALREHGAVEDAAVELGSESTARSPGDGIVLQARVTLKRKVSPERLTGYCASRLSLYKVPGEIVIVKKL